MTGKDLASMYEFGYFALNRNFKDLTHDDSVHIPEADGNCINWVLVPCHFRPRHDAPTKGSGDTVT